MEEIYRVVELEEHFEALRQELTELLSLQEDLKRKKETLILKITKVEDDLIIQLIETLNYIEKDVENAELQKILKMRFIDNQSWNYVEKIIPRAKEKFENFKDEYEKNKMKGDEK